MGVAKGRPQRAAAVVALLLISWPWSPKEPEPPSPLPGDNGMDTSFGTIVSELHRSFLSEPVDWEARVVLKPDSTPQAERFLFALVPQTGTARVQFTELTTASGTPLVIEQDQRTPGALVPQVFVNRSAMPPAGEEIVLRGTVELDNNGRYQVGALVIAFDPAWKKVTTPEGEIAQLYGYGYVGASELAGRNPPFEGSGNVAPAGLVFLIAAIVAAGLAAALFWLRAPAQRAPVAAPPARPVVVQPPPRRPVAAATRPPARPVSAPPPARPVTQPPPRRPFVAAAKPPAARPAPPTSTKPAPTKTGAARRPSRAPGRARPPPRRTSGRLPRRSG